MRSGLSSWLRSLPLRRRVSYLTTVAVALAVAASGAAAYVTIRVSLYRALDNDLVNTATSVAAVTVAEDVRNLSGLTERALRGEQVNIAAVRADGELFFVPQETDQLVLGPQELAIARTQYGTSVRTGVVGQRQGVPDRRGADHRSRQLRAGAGPAAGTDQHHPQLALGGLDHLRRDRRRRGRDGGGDGRPVQPAAGTPAGRRRGARDRHQGAGPDQDRRHRRPRDAGRLVQPDAALARVVAASGRPG